MANVQEYDVGWVKVPDDEERKGQEVENELADERRRKKANIAALGRNLFGGIGWHIARGLLMRVWGWWWW